MQVLMPILKEEFDRPNLMTNPLLDLVQDWYSRLSTDYPDQNAANRESIIRWLLGNLEQLETLNPIGLQIAQQKIEYRYRILQHRLGLEPELAYRHFITRLGRLVLLHHKVRAWVALNPNHASAVVDVLQAVIQELLLSDRYIQQQITTIAELTEDLQLRNALLLATLEEYCLRPVRNQPLLIYRFVNYLRRSSSDK